FQHRTRADRVPGVRHRRDRRGCAGALAIPGSAGSDLHHGGLCGGRPVGDQRPVGCALSSADAHHGRGLGTGHWPSRRHIRTWPGRLPAGARLAGAAHPSVRLPHLPHRRTLRRAAATARSAGGAGAADAAGVKRGDGGRRAHRFARALDSLRPDGDNRRHPPTGRSEASRIGTRRPALEETLMAWHTRRQLIRRTATLVATGLAAPSVWRGDRAWAAGASVTLKLGHPDTTLHPVQTMALKLSDLVSKKTDGAVKIRVFSGGQLGSETNLVAGMQTGIVDMAFHTTGFLESFFPKVQVLDLPFLFKDAKSAET